MYNTLSIDHYREQFGQQEHLLIDVREDEEYRQGRIPGARSIPLSQFQSRVSEIESGRPVVLVCATRNRSAMAAQYMASLGYADLHIIRDGTVGWMLRGLPLER